MTVLATTALGKRFGGVQALSGVDFALSAGEVHALCGENGAGKSTLIKLLGGVHPYGSYQGAIEVFGKPATFASPRDAERAGISVIYQELALVPEMTVAENLLLGSAPRRRGLVDWNALYAETRSILAEAAIDLDPTARVAELGVGRKQLVEIARAVRKKSRILILDEPTAALSAHEVAALLDLVERYRAAGIACVYVSHKLDEVFRIADRITVLRDGRSIVTLPRAATSPREIIRHMVGREIADLFPRRERRPGKPLLTVRGLSVAPKRGQPALLRDIDLELRAGEVLGIGGLMGAGRSELLMHLFGSFGVRLAGSVELAGLPLPLGTPEQLLGRGLALVSEDRKRHGLIADRSVGYHLTLSSIARFARHGLIDTRREHRAAAGLFESLQVRARDLETPAFSLSGGNQQKVILGRALLAEPKVLMLDEPTRGVDVGAKVEVYELIARLTTEGKGVLLVSSELPELIGLSDRILMLHQGRITGSFSAGVGQEALLAAAMGKTPELAS